LAGKARTARNEAPRPSAGMEGSRVEEGQGLHSGTITPERVKGKGGKKGQKPSALDSPRLRGDKQFREKKLNRRISSRIRLRAGRELLSD